ncbi:hypothetical protein PHYSODRAFT_263589 [Phytophthora sojae]|uniref:RxLR effector protein n=1 Tax=Phytophthora sojae (strain P6497) TaxID=1094619 RepID=G5AJI2_PHYSP|nr:hypothetical protein PHYSODRAFT_263589 [Phytophthora sojae]EGZ04318.1 hypothetical protein PHYSODRAFT_263589 [Phytophthora sojae]|eukprot:XP_009540233.1 hypothetical protein PHYSODRAFT_263589 [Phytophthora sojae]
MKLLTTLAVATFLGVASATDASVETESKSAVRNLRVQISEQVPAIPAPAGGPTSPRPQSPLQHARHPSSPKAEPQRGNGHESRHGGDRGHDHGGDHETNRRSPTPRSPQHGSPQRPRSPNHGDHLSVVTPAGRGRHDGRDYESDRWSPTTPPRSPRHWGHPSSPMFAPARRGHHDVHDYGYHDGRDYEDYEWRTTAPPRAPRHWGHPASPTAAPAWHGHHDDRDHESYGWATVEPGRRPRNSEPRSPRHSRPSSPHF